MSAPFFTKAVAITPNDSTVITPPFKGIYVGGAGNVSVGLEDGSNLVFTAPPVGSVIPVQARIVRATGTTATALVGLWD